jgi:hypothetical protein
LGATAVTAALNELWAPFLEKVGEIDLVDDADSEAEDSPKPAERRHWRHDAATWERTSRCCF